MLFNVLAIIAASAVSALAAPAITYPRTGTIWTQGYTHNITWAATSGTGDFSLISSGGSRSLASGVDLSSGRTVVNVPTVNGGDGYKIRLAASDGSTSESGSFAFGAPDVPGSTGGSSGSVTVSTTTTTASGSSTGAAGSASSAASSIASSASSAASSASASLSSALSSLSSQASAGASSISSRASSALSSATAPSGSGSGASSTSSGSAAIGSASLGDFKAGMAVTAGLLVVSMLGGLTIF